MLLNTNYSKIDYILPIFVNNLHTNTTAAFQLVEFKLILQSSTDHIYLEND